MTERHLAQITDTLWVSRGEETNVRETTITTSTRFGRSFLEYSKDGTFGFHGRFGKWELYENKYLAHNFNQAEVDGQLNFGGIFSVTELSDSTMTLVKVLSSSHDMKRTIYFTAVNRKDFFDPLQIAKPRKKDKPPRKKDKPLRIYSDMTPFLKEPDPKEFKRIGKLRTNELLHYGFDFKNDTIFIHIQDSLYKIKRKFKE